MSPDETFEWDSLSYEEAESVDPIVQKFGGASWARPLIGALTHASGISRETKPLMFELRFAAALAEMGIEPSYEIQGEGHSTIDFGSTIGMCIGKSNCEINGHHQRVV